MSDQTILDMDALFDQKMGAVETAPDFVNPPAGFYALEIKECGPEKYKTKAENNKPSVEKTRIKTLITVVETKELSDTSQPPVSNGSLFSLQNNADEEGVKYFKRFAMNVMNATEADVADASFKDIFSGMKGFKFDAAITIAKSSKDGKDYENIRVRPIHTPKS